MVTIPTSPLLLEYETVKAPIPEQESINYLYFNQAGINNAMTHILVLSAKVGRNECLNEYLW